MVAHLLLSRDGREDDPLTGFTLVAGDDLGWIHEADALRSVFHGPAPHPALAAAVDHAGASAVGDGLNAALRGVLPLGVGCRGDVFDAALLVAGAYGSGQVHLVPVGDEERDAALVTDLGLTFADESRPDVLPVSRRLGEDGPVVVGEEAHNQEEVQKTFRRRRFEGAFGVRRKAFAHPGELARAHRVVADVARLREEARPALGRWRR